MQTKSKRIIAIANQKGGVGKTTTAINLAAGLAKKGNKTLLIDIDPQGNASTGLGVLPEDRDQTVYDVLVDQKPVKDAIIPTSINNLSLLASNTDLSSADVELMSDKGRLLRLRSSLADLSDYKYVFIDCPPSLNLLTLNAFAASDSVLVPLQSEFFALEGLSQLMLTVKELRQTLGSTLFIDGVVLTMFDRRNKLSQQVELDVRENLGDLVYDAIIPRSVRLSEAPSYGESVFQYDAAGKGAAAYLALASEFLKRDKSRSK
ncbi:chromosome partitioning protein ParA [Amylibacter marinus]|uniref:Chromosome partitioning protein ParA n=1 Tax=Amylibacter marinus TaxID=1475483 RepID=A0ABQ5VW62_9RHOB|nr:AAA family ATPase [Amylibacter marinus]GLQ35523.1 chromosome partitioning protein ParA [Amylibacter marinus]